MQDENKKIKDQETGNSKDKKYIHVNDIPTDKLDDEDFMEEENDSQKNSETLEERSEREKNQGNDTIGIP